MTETVPVTSADLLPDGGLLQVDGLVLMVRISPRRTRLGLTIERDGSVVVRAPEGCVAARAEEFVRGHRQWIESKLRLRGSMQPLHTPRALVDGEVFRYLGRAHRLLLVDEPGMPVRMVAGRLRLDRTEAVDPVRGGRAVVDWYTRVGRAWASGRFQPWAARMDVPEPELKVSDLGLRWGAFTPAEATPGGRMALNWAVFQLPMHLVDYVIAHELAHVRVAGHGAEYWRLLRRAIPECEELKAELDDLGRRVWLGTVAVRREH
ncbi:M48 family metallopeptidase [Streptomyces sp. A3M-1-3]|uniref:M48 family metallopeptidase n=1 Tax=Streptomyces sp. A3M-1-3 TaxID=2962044 RepID=UPI0020B65CA6|nr:SprT family zinc-dependent metalloprotease [Streptomyces sp. A3M-1-3]MCP3818850.1 M48 family metallopeptidase [Streptomyces sp. A3M-1-3]